METGVEGGKICESFRLSEALSDHNTLAWHSIPCSNARGWHCPYLRTLRQAHAERRRQHTRGSGGGGGCGERAKRQTGIEAGLRSRSSREPFPALINPLKRPGRQAEAAIATITAQNTQRGDAHTFSINHIKPPLQCCIAMHLDHITFLGWLACSSRVGIQNGQLACGQGPHPCGLSPGGGKTAQRIRPVIRDFKRLVNECGERHTGMREAPPEDWDTDQPNTTGQVGSGPAGSKRCSGV